ncbi:MAG: sulfatase-like hydrolase/transferase [Verrucomicrobia bacterium]|nr:sulfatase-like hydrolase/transferase [Verrucomicrobiota bacterium]
MPKRSCGIVLAAGWLSLTAAVSISATAAMPGRRPPNIIVILADDLGAECLSCYGSTSYKTPNLDALASGGIRFLNCYATPLCSPSRVELMTGRYGFRTGWTNMIERGEGAVNEFFDPSQERTFGHVLKAAGYTTALAGKWQLAQFQKHPRHVNESGFDEYCCWTWLYDGKRTDRYWKPSVWQDGKLRDDVSDKYGEDIFCDFLIDFIERNQTKPFFAYYPMVLVHEPFQPTPDEKKNGVNQTEKKRSDVSHFPAMVAYMDKTVGRLLATLDRLGLRENTLILFTGDNGTPPPVTSRIGATIIRGGKGTVTHLGAHVPLIASWKGTIPAGRVVEDLIDFSDVLPTLAEVAGAQLPRDVRIDGHSFAARLRGKRARPREWVYVQLGGKSFVRDQRWLLHNDGRFYDIQNDPFEQVDLGLQPKNRKAVARLKQISDSVAQPANPFK